MKLTGRMLAIGAGLLMLGGVVTATYGSSGIECVACEWAVAKVEEYVSSNATEQAVEAVVEKVCVAVPSITQVCERVVEEYWPYLVNFIINRETPNLVCQEIKLCSQALMN